jgi:hypothetical protein
VKEYDIFVPLYYNDGTPIESAKFQHLQSLLLERFEGLTYFPQPNRCSREGTPPVRLLKPPSGHAISG